MPPKSPAQQRLMRAAAHNKSFAQEVGVPQKVAKEFVHKDAQSGNDTTQKAKDREMKMTKPEGGRFDEATYERARKFREQAASAPKPAAKPAAKAPSKTRVSNPVPKKAMEQAKDMRHMQDTISASERNATKPMKGNTGQGPTRAAAFERSMRANLTTSEKDEMNKYRDRAVGAAGAAASMAVPGMAAARAARAVKSAAPAAKEAGKTGVRYQSRVTPSASKSAAAPASTDATRQMVLNRVGKPAPKLLEKATKSAPSARKRTRYNEDEAKTEFKSGGMTKRGYGCAKRG